MVANLQLLIDINSLCFMQSFPAGVHYMETSTHNQYGRNVEEVFTSLAQKILRERDMESGNGQASCAIATDQSLSRSKRYTLSLSRFKRKEKVNLTQSVCMGDSEDL